MNYFQSCKTIAEVKSLYKTLAKENHPDRGGNTAIMQAINLEYSIAIKRAAAGEDLSQAEYDAEILNAEQYKNAVNAIINLEGIVIEICGGWLWVSGNTYQHRAIFKANGFYFASVKKVWYFRSPIYATSSKGKTLEMEQIRKKYGTQTISKGFSNYLAQ